MQNRVKNFLALVFVCVFLFTACAVDKKKYSENKNNQIEFESESDTNIIESSGVREEFSEMNIENGEIWSRGVWLRTREDELLCGFSESVSEKINEIPEDVSVFWISELETLKKDGILDKDNHVGIEDCFYYKTDENHGYVFKSYRHVQANAPMICEVCYLDENGYTRILQSGYGQIFSAALCDGEYLYFVVSDGDLWRVDKNGEIKTYPAFEDYVPVGYLSLEANGDEITIISYGDEDNFVINVRK